MEKKEQESSESLTNDGFIKKEVIRNLCQEALKEKTTTEKADMWLSKNDMCAERSLTCLLPSCTACAMPISTKDLVCPALTVHRIYHFDAAELR
eukprot:5612748-Prymnesium_polylepis.1